MRIALTIALASALLIAVPGIALSQDRDVLFLHGLGSSGDTWAAAAARLETRAAITPARPDLPWNKTFADQAQELDDQLSWLPANTIVIGHSNGGVVGRAWNRSYHPIGGIVTVGTPIFGAPLINNLAWYVDYDFQMYLAGREVADAFFEDRFETWQDVLWAIARDISVTDLLATRALPTLLYSVLQLEPFLPITYDMEFPVSSTVNGPGSLNGETNLSREYSDVPHRVAIASIAHNFYWGGPIRAAFPAYGDRFAGLRDLGVAAMRAGATRIDLDSDPADVDATELSIKLRGWARIVEEMDESWCRAVSAPGQLVCNENDTIVPVWDQLWSDIPAITRVVVRGPAHTQMTGGGDPNSPSPVIEEVVLDGDQTQSSLPSQTMDDVIYNTLNGIMSVPAR